ncbi:PilV family protein [Thermovibrio ammonificans]|uniref:Prepilin-type N-terminal cleavage/methylation domain-containing protein n=1 Tax=Thermovibrio ammonificans (strain DSM 15698 / JCM 12110 / HB-1) TaxID=648996 RepID=E8T2L4_THEA1|nr:hypothetical protein [Thermovibrio ammonificans]ADU97109.1 hypothetical protein Theam_1145 [Thermovibrio ammonificans HB-1]
MRIVKRKIKRGAFSMVEVLLAVAIGLVVFLGLLASAVFVKKFEMVKMIQYQAVRLLHQKLEQVREMDYDNVTEANLDNGTTSCKDALLTGKNVVVRYIWSRPQEYGLYYDINENTALELKEVNLTVCWFYKGRYHSISGTTIIRKEL